MFEPDKSGNMSVEGALLCCRDSDRSLESMRFAERAVSLRCLGRIGRGREDVRKRGGRREDGLKVEEQQGQTDRQSRSRLRSKEHPARRWKNEGRQVRRGRYEHVGRSDQVRSGQVWLAGFMSFLLSTKVKSTADSEGSIAGSVHTVMSSRYT